MDSLHWLVDAARKAGLPGADAADVSADAPAGQAWATVLKQTGGDEAALVRAAAAHFHIDPADFDRADPAARALMPRETAEKHTLFPLSFEYSTLVVATADPADYDAEQEIAFTSGRYAAFRMAAPWAIVRAIQAGYGGDTPGDAPRESRGRERGGGLAWSAEPAAAASGPGTDAEPGLETAPRGAEDAHAGAGPEKPLIMPEVPGLEANAEAAEAPAAPGAAAPGRETTGAGPARGGVAGAGPERGARPAKKLRVLIVDDDAESRFLVRAVLSKEGFTVVEAVGGSAALDMLKRGDRFALAIVDLMMPEMDGRQLVSAIRHAPPPEVRRMPVIVLTASRIAADEPQLLRDGADDYIRKPIDPPVFNARIAAVLRRAGV